MRVFNFAAGPATMPLEVLEEAREQLSDWRGSGMSVMEVSHRGKAFTAVAQEAEIRLRELLAIPRQYKVLFLSGGATGQFAAIPLNLTRTESTVDYLNTGAWSKKAIAEAQRFTHVHVAADEAASRYTTVPAAASVHVSPQAAYLHYTANETIGGVEFPYIPESGTVPLIADMSSSILSRPVPVERFGLIYAGAQKNIGPAGLAVVIVRDDLIGHARPETPSIFDYQAMADDNSMLNTPPTFAWYIAGLVFKWLQAQGGLPVMAARNEAKAQLLYATIDRSGFYRNPVAHACRSWMNVPFTLRDPSLDEAFLTQARAAGLVNLEGHRSVGGMRASLYNAMPPEGVQALVAFMQEFERRHG
ncbi:MAG TPA: 3-phosphoserine/phosphohydroxythreonine transaminase [Steroidobacteraceae bacterium]|nr:3-phosphoserine/phosphohydroxythreonine transaminase [Steroidobacteraceae bacterium]